MFGIPAFDIINIDMDGETECITCLDHGAVESWRCWKAASFCAVAGAEGMVFAPDSDVSWARRAKLVSVEPHSWQAKYFGLKVIDCTLLLIHLLHYNPTIHQMLAPGPCPPYQCVANSGTALLPSSRRSLELG